ncbi:hypothetical protein CPC08DRAFT_719099 [Agrocybe pediades]|nr:hypothetical protein CPC08DRAFT_719099 [Agrocybe pediades]
MTGASAWMLPRCWHGPVSRFAAALVKKIEIGSQSGVGRVDRKWPPSAKGRASSWKACVQPLHTRCGPGTPPARSKWHGRAMIVIAINRHDPVSTRRQKDIEPPPLSTAFILYHLQKSWHKRSARERDLELGFRRDLRRTDICIMMGIPASDDNGIGKALCLEGFIELSRGQ